MKPTKTTNSIKLTKDYDLKVRVDEPTHDKILKYCEDNKQSKITKAEAVRMAIDKFFRW